VRTPVSVWDAPNFAWSCPEYLARLMTRILRVVGWEKPRGYAAFWVVVPLHGMAGIFLLSKMADRRSKPSAISLPGGSGTRAPCVLRLRVLGFCGGYPRRGGSTGARATECRWCTRQKVSPGS